uniref:Extracellular ligand-binding receptor n=1 Tax=Solibacter usitatus (strain Ellin6076) TaxID=234267 RepID=Q01TK4_SOLUE
MRDLVFAVAALALWFGAARAQTVPCRVPGANAVVAPPPSRTLEPYANTPEDLRPFSRFTKPYYENYTKSPEYNGTARDLPEADIAKLDEVAIAFLGPIAQHKDEALGQAMLHGAEMAVKEANVRGGYCGKPFALKVHNDAATWGASSNEIVRMVYDEKVWAMLGSISGDSTHIALRVSLRAELPIVNSASTDPTIPETIIPWSLTAIQDDRVQGYTLARRIYTDLGLKRIALLRVNERYGRFGVIKFRDASRRLGHPVVIEQKFAPSDQSFTRQLAVINDSRVDGIVLWADAGAAGTILKQMHEMGMKQPVFGSFRVVGDDLFRNAGAFAEGLEVVYPFDPNRDHAVWTGFQKRFETAYHAKVDAFSALGFDTMNVLLGAIGRAGLNRGRIRDELYGLERYPGVTGEMIFDPNAKNSAPMYLGKVKDGKLTYRRYSMEKPYATVGENGVRYAGPPLPDAVRKEPKIGIFGPGAEAQAAKLDAPGHRVAGINSDVPWGKASTELVKMVYDPSVIGLVATDRQAAHLAMQLAVKNFVPVIAVSADRTLTSTNVPWIFRVSPETSLAEAVGCLTDAARQAGWNRGRIRELLASGARVGGRYAFDATGEMK